MRLHPPVRAGGLRECVVDRVRIGLHERVAGRRKRLPNGPRRGVAGIAPGAVVPCPKTRVVRREANPDLIGRLRRRESSCQSCSRSSRRLEDHKAPVEALAVGLGLSRRHAASDEDVVLRAGGEHEIDADPGLATPKVISYGLALAQDANGVGADARGIDPRAGAWEQRPRR